MRSWHFSIVSLTPGRLVLRSPLSQRMATYFSVLLCGFFIFILHYHIDDRFFGFVKYLLICLEILLIYLCFIRKKLTIDTKYRPGITYEKKAFSSKVST